MQPLLHFEEQPDLVFARFGISKYSACSIYWTNLSERQKRGAAFIRSMSIYFTISPDYVLIIFPPIISMWCLGGKCGMWHIWTLQRLPTCRHHVLSSEYAIHLGLVGENGNYNHLPSLLLDSGYSCDFFLVIMESKGGIIERLRVLVKKYKEHTLASKKRCDLRVMILHAKLKKLKTISATMVKELEALKEESNTLGRRISKMGLANYLKMIQLDLNYRNEINSSMTTCLVESFVFMEMEIRLNGKLEEIKEYQKDNECCLFQLAIIEKTLKRWEDAATK